MGPVSAACAFEMGSCPAIASAPDIEPNFRRLRRFIVFPLADMFVVGGCMVDFFKSLTENPSFGQCKGYANELFVLVFSGFKAGKGERRNAGLAVMHRFGAKADRTPCGGAPSEGVERGRADLRSIFRAQITGTSSAAERS